MKAWSMAQFKAHQELKSLRKAKKGVKKGGAPKSKVIKPQRAKKCKNPKCKKEFMPKRHLQTVCSVQCAVELTSFQREKQEKKEWGIRKAVLREKTMSHKDYLKLLQVVFNTFIRLRDADRGCVSCGATVCEEFHAGHFVATTHQFLRFDEDNVWKQCSKCNTHLRGNLIPYRIELIKRIGKERVEELENQRHNTLKLSIPEIKEKISYYKEKIKEFKK